jgi:hypothetical protein
MKNPFPVNLQTSAEVRGQGWQAESRDADGHLISCHAPIEANDGNIAEWIVECTSRGETVTFWPTNGDVLPAPISPHLVIKRIADVASAVGWQSGEPALEAAGHIVSVLAIHPEHVDRFLAEGPELFIDGTFKPENGSLTYRSIGGDILSPTVLRKAQGSAQ